MNKIVREFCKRGHHFARMDKHPRLQNGDWACPHCLAVSAPRAVKELAEYPIDAVDTHQILTLVQEAFVRLHPHAREVALSTEEMLKYLIRRAETPTTSPIGLLGSMFGIAIPLELDAVMRNISLSASVATDPPVATSPTPVLELSVPGLSSGRVIPLDFRKVS